MAARKRSSTQTAADSTKKAKTDSPETGSEAIEVGDKLPSISLEDQDQEPVNLSEVPGLLVLFAYPKASTPGCTRQTNGFGKDYGKFQELGATVYGISADSPKAQTTFKNKLDLPFDLLSDPTYALLGPLGAKKSPKGVIRSHWVFQDGVLKFVEHQVKPDASPSTCLAEVEELSATEPAEEEAAETERPDAEFKPKDTNEDDIPIRVTELKGEPEQGLKVDDQLPLVQSPEPTLQEEKSNGPADAPNVEEVAASTEVTSPTAQPTIKEPTEEPSSPAPAASPAPAGE